jgi:hypothetical protein
LDPRVLVALDKIDQTRKVRDIKFKLFETFWIYLCVVLWFTYKFILVKVYRQRFRRKELKLSKFQLWMSIDHGKIWVPIHQYVKAFFWSSNRVLYVERTEFNGVGNTVLKLDLRNWPWYQRTNNSLRIRLSIRKEFTVVIENVEDFQIRGDYMFATKKNSKARYWYCIILHAWVFMKLILVDSRIRLFLIVSFIFLFSV